MRAFTGLVLAGLLAGCEAQNAGPVCKKHWFEIEWASGKTGEAYADLWEFIKKTDHPKHVYLFASLFDEAFSAIDENGNEYIVLPLEHLNKRNRNFVRGLVAHEFGHNLSRRLREGKLGSVNITLEQQIADGFAVELVGPEVFTEYLQKQGWDEKGAKEAIKNGINAVKLLRKITQN